MARIVAVVALMSLAACGGLESGGLEIGGPGLPPLDQELVGDDPFDDGTINEGVGSVIP